MEAEHKIQNCLFSESEESARPDQNCPKPFHIYGTGLFHGPALGTWGLTGDYGLDIRNSV